MPSTRKKLTRDERHAAAILMITRGDGTPIVSREEAKGMTAKEIIEAFAARTHVEHIVPHALTGNNHPSNIQYLAPDEHKPKTSRDISEIAKTKRIEGDHEAFRRKMLAKAGQSDASDVGKTTTKPTRKIKSRGFQKRPDGHKYNWGNRKMGRHG